jgi:hypothetical protein
MLPPLPAVYSCFIQLFGFPPSAGAAKWDTAKWDGVTSVWYGQDWIDVTPQSLHVNASWGSDDNAGALSLTSAGSWSIATYDPQRLLDPANYASPFVSGLVPGEPVRIIYREGGIDTIVRQGFVDEVGFNIETYEGSIRATDGISLLVKAKVPEDQVSSAPLTLRAFSRFMLAQAQVSYITVEPDPDYPEWDPPVGAAIEGGASVWQQITAAALDALNAAWLDGTGVLRFRYFGKPFDTGVIIGTGGIPIEDVKTSYSMQGVVNHTRAKYFSFDDIVNEAINQPNVDAYGDLLLDRQRPQPNSAEWADQILQDRGQSAVQYEIGTLRPRTPEELRAILALGMADMVHLHVQTRTPPINRTVTVLGGSIEANTDTGWSAHLVTYEPASAWWNKDADRLYQYKAIASKSNEFHYKDQQGMTGNADFADQQIYQTPSTGVQEFRQVALGFPVINFAGMATIWDAKLRIYLPFHDDTPQGDNMPRVNEADWIRALNITAAWDETTQTAPATDVTGATFAARTDLGKWIEFDLRAIINRWYGGVAQNGLLLLVHPNVPPAIQHAILSGRRSQNAPYILLLYKR